MAGPGRPDAYPAGLAASDGRRRIQLAVLLALFIALGFGIVLSAPHANAKQKFMSGFAQAYPSAAGTPLDSCLLCHTDPVRPEEDNLNSYGEDWEDGDFGDKNYLAPNLVNRDSDGDGVPNGQEIQQLSLPGDSSSSTPPTTTTTLPGTPPDGQALYAARCAACHGPNGGDLSGTNLGRSTFITITINGQGSMPAQSNLSDQEAGAIWDYVTGTVPPTTTTTLPGATTTTTVPRSGAAVYAADCALCHGQEAANLKGHDLGLSQIVAITANGVGTMRGYAGELSSAEIDNVSRYIAAFGAGAGGGATTTTAPGGSAISGSTLYMQNCSGCHGLHGEGGPGGAVAGTDIGRSEIISVTNNGTSGMPGYGSQLTADEVDAIVDHILAITSDPAEAGDGMVDAQPTIPETAAADFDDRQDVTSSAGLPLLNPLAGDPDGDGAPSAPVLVAVFLALVVAGGAAAVWVRSARNLVR